MNGVFLIRGRIFIEGGVCWGGDGMVELNGYPSHMSYLATVTYQALIV